MNIEVPIPDKDYKVLVRCATYNHSKYICDALNGFAIQETDFPFICIVVDDASKDGNQEVIRQYANDNCDMSKAEISEDDISKYIRVPHKTNENCVFLFCLLKVNLYGKPEKREIYKPYREVCEYEAICEGDDWWLDSKKIQKQCSYLDNHSEYSMCFHNAIEKWEETNEEALFSNIQDCEYSGEEIFKEWIVPTASVILRVKLFDTKEYHTYLTQKMARGDTPTFLTAANYGKIRGMSDVMSVYRRNAGGFTQKKISVQSVSKFVSDLRQYPLIWGNEYKKLSQSITNKAIVDFEMYSLKKMDFHSFKEIHNIVRHEEFVYYISALFSYPIRMIHNKMKK